MSAETEKNLIDWANEDRDPVDDCHRHFRDFGAWDWTEVAFEGRRVWGLMFDNEIEEFSAMDAVIGGVAAQASYGAFCAVAAALGVHADDVMIAASYWTKKIKTEPVGMAEFMRLIQESAADRARNDSPDSGSA